MPERETITGSSSGSSDGIVRLADWGPSEAGVKIREILAEASGISISSEILPLEIVNWLSSIVILPIMRLAEPALVTVTFSVALGVLTSTSSKSIEVGSTMISGFGVIVVPLPERETVIVGGSLEGIDRVADWSPADAGVKIREMLAEALGIRV